MIIANKYLQLGNTVPFDSISPLPASASKTGRGKWGCPSENTFLIPQKVIRSCWDAQRGRERIRDLQERKIKITLISLRCAVFFQELWMQRSQG